MPDIIGPGRLKCLLWGCTYKGKYFVRGYCDPHYKQMMRGGGEDKVLREVKVEGYWRKGMKGHWRTRAGRRIWIAESKPSWVPPTVRLVLRNNPEPSLKRIGRGRPSIPRPRPVNGDRTCMQDGCTSKAEVKGRCRRCYDKHDPARIAYRRQYYAANRQKIIQKVVEWERTQDPEKIRARKRATTARYKAKRRREQGLAGRD